MVAALEEGETVKWRGNVVDFTGTVSDAIGTPCRVGRCAGFTDPQGEVEHRIGASVAVTRISERRLTNDRASVCDCVPVYGNHVDESTMRGEETMPNYDPDPDFYARYPICAYTGKPCEGVCEHYCGALEGDEPAVTENWCDDNRFALSDRMREDGERLLLGEIEARDAEIERLREALVQHHAVGDAPIIGDTCPICAALDGKKIERLTLERDYAIQSINRMKGEIGTLKNEINRLMDILTRQEDDNNGA